MPADPRLVAQIRLILETHEDAAVFPPDWEETGEVDYLYRKEVIHSSSEDVPRVLESLGRDFPSPAGSGRPAPSPGEAAGPARFTHRSVSPGVTQISLSHPDFPEPPAVPRVLEALDSVLGPGVATPDHLMYVCPYPCPATEPGELSPGTVSPFPSPGSRRPGSGAVLPGGDGAGVSVIIADTGLLPGASADHSWLAGVTGTPEDPYDPVTRYIRTYAGHGTFVAGCVRSVAPKAQVFVEKIFDTGAESFESDLYPALEAALDRHPDARVIVLTFTTASRGDRPLKTFEEFYARRLAGPDVVVLAPAGNDGKSRPMWPAASPGVISVGALSASWQERAHFSNHGDWVKVYTPGEKLVNAFASGTYVCSEPPQGARRHFYGLAEWSGTSFSTPLMAGLIAARMSATGETGQQAARALLQLAGEQTVDGIGPVLYPGQELVPDPAPAVP
ncbi:MAG TPA: S8 family serine peptidase [Trebonia sp.]